MTEPVVATLTDPTPPTAYSNERRFNSGDIIVSRDAIYSFICGENQDATDYYQNWKEFDQKWS